MATTGVITAYLKDIAILEEEAERRAKDIHGADYDVNASKANREEFLKIRKDVCMKLCTAVNTGEKKLKLF